MAEAQPLPGHRPLSPGSFNYYLSPRHSCRNGNSVQLLSPTPVILAEAGIQSPFSHLTSTGLQEWSRWEIGLSTRRVLADKTVLAHEGVSGFPLRRE